MTMTKKSRYAALAKTKYKAAATAAPTGELQAGPRSAQSQTLNYMSVQTLDPSRLASAFALADQGDIQAQATLFELVEEHDPHVFSELSKRRRAVTGLGWQLDPKDDASQSELDRCAELHEMLEDIPQFEDAQYDLTDAIGKGFAALEIEWQKGSQWLPKVLHWVPQRTMHIDRDTGEIKVVINGMPQPLRPNGWVVHQHRAKSGYIEQAALFRVLAWTYAYKAYNVLDMQKFLEKYGLPLRLGKFPSGIAKADRDLLLKAVRSIGSDGAGVVPDTMSIEFVQAAATGNVTDFLSAIQYWERKQSMAILGGTLTSQADGKSSTNALGEVHDKVRREIVMHDVRQLAPTISQQIVAPIALYNGMFAADRMPKFCYDTKETVDQQMMVGVLEKAVDLGLEIDVEWAYEALQIPRAGKGATIIGKRAKPPADPAAAAAALTRLVALAKAKDGSGGSEVLPAYIAQLTALAAPHEQSMVQQIAAIVGEAGDFDAAIEAIEALTVNTRPTALAQTIAQALSASNLAGRGEA
jgi:phage gp29-like protein